MSLVASDTSYELRRPLELVYFIGLLLVAKPKGFRTRLSLMCTSYLSRKIAFEEWVRYVIALGVGSGRLALYAPSTVLEQLHNIAKGCYGRADYYELGMGWYPDPDAGMSVSARRELEKRCKSLIRQTTRDAEFFHMRKVLDAKSRRTRYTVWLIVRPCFLDGLHDGARLLLIIYTKPNLCSTLRRKGIGVGKIVYRPLWAI